MAIPKNILKEWFSNLKKPPEEQFWGWQDAFWHKLEMITISSIENLSNILSKKADLVDGVVPENQLPFSALTSEIISLGDVSVVGNKTILAVHSSGQNKVRVKGQIIIRTFPNVWTITPIVADGTKVLRGYAVKGEPDFFLAEGPELPEIVDPEIPEGALELFKITLNLGGSTVVVPASGYKLKQESNWQNIAIKSNASPVILDQPSDVRGSFYLTKSLGVGEITIEAIKRLSSGTVAKDYMYGGRELLLFNATGGNIIIDSSAATDPDSYFFSDRITPFTLKNDTGVLVKLRGDVIELLPSGSDPDLSPYALDTDLDAEIVNRALADTNLQNQLNAANLLIADLQAPQITITTSSSITTDTLSTVNSRAQNGKNVIIDNGVNAINLQCVGTSPANFCASYSRLGAAAVTITAAAGFTVEEVYSGSGKICNGAIMSSFTLERVGTKFYLKLNNA